MIVIVEDVQRTLIVNHDTEQLFGLIRGNIMAIQYLFDQVQRLAQFFQPPLVGRIAFVEALYWVRFFIGSSCCKKCTN